MFACGPRPLIIWRPEINRRWPNKFHKGPADYFPVVVLNINSLRTQYICRFANMHWWDLFAIYFITSNTRVEIICYTLHWRILWAADKIFEKGWQMHLKFGIFYVEDLSHIPVAVKHQWIKANCVCTQLLPPYQSLKDILCLCRQKLESYGTQSAIAAARSPSKSLTQSTTTVHTCTHITPRRSADTACEPHHSVRAE